MSRLLLQTIIFSFFTVFFCDTLKADDSFRNIYMNSSRGYHSFKHSTPEGIILDNLSDSLLTDEFFFERPLKSFEIKFRASDSRNNPLSTNKRKTLKGEKIAKDEGWCFSFSSGDKDSFGFKLSRIEMEDGISSNAGAQIIIEKDGKKIETVTLTEDFDLYRGANQWKVLFNDKKATIYAGHRKAKKIADVVCDFDSINSISFKSFPGACLKITDLSVTNNQLYNFPLFSDSETSEICKRIEESKDPLEGYWMIFDRSLDESLLKIGGDYKFILIKEGSYYYLVYLSGAIVNKDLWKTGMTKARFTPDPFPATYSVEWIDSEGKIMTNSIKAQSEDNQIITIQFPYQGSSLRLRKVVQ